MQRSNAVRNFCFKKLVIAACAVFAFSPLIGFCAGTVTNLNWLDLQDALSGGGTVTIACDGVIYKPYTDPIDIRANTVIDATGHNVILDGWSGWGGQLFDVWSGFTLTLSNLTVANCIANTNGGAIMNSGTLYSYGCVFSNNWAQGLSGTNGANGADVTSGTAGSGTAGTVGKNGYGGAIYSEGTLVVNGGSFVFNAALGGVGGSGGNGGSTGSGTPGNGSTGAIGGSAFGGAIYSTNVLAITNCFFLGNYAIGARGGYGGNAGASGSSVGANGVGGIGGDGWGAAIYVYRAATVVNSTFYLNTVVGGNGGNNGLTFGAANTTGPKGGNSYGAAIFNAGTNNFINCTIDANISAGGSGGNGGVGTTGQGGTGGNGGLAWGGGIYSTNRIGLTNCTLAANAAIGGLGGVGGFPSGVSGTSGGFAGANIVRTNGTFTLKNSILAGGTGVGGNGVGTFVDAGQNISDDNSITLNGTGSHSSTDPKLASDVNFNGGPTPTLALLAGSPAINAADNSAAPTYDQRTFMRVGTPDIGAFEYDSATLRVYAPGQIASLDGDIGLFIVGGLSASLTPFTASLVISGTASNGVDYIQTTNTVVIPTTITNIANYLRIPIRGIAGAFSAANRSVTVTLVSGANYVINPNDPANPNTASVTLSDHSTIDTSARYKRGTSTASDFNSLVVPLNFQTGVALDASGGNANSLYPGNSWTSTLYHFDATNAALQTNLTGRIAFQNPLAAFGSRVGGSPLYENQSYSFGIYAGDPSAIYSSALRIQVYYRSNSALAGTISIPVPDPSITNQLANLVTNGFAQTFEQFGLRTVLLDSPDQRWGVMFSRTYVLSHTATSDVATNYYYVVEEKGSVLFQPLVLNASGVQDYSKLYVMEFTPFPANRPLFIDQPHFDGKPLPPAYQGKSLEELTNVTATLPDLSSLVSSNYLALDGSPELRRHPILDQFVKDMRNDPLALANYVINEIGLVDAIDYDTNYNTLPAVNLGGVNRSALATFQEGQGSPVEQCALLVYLLRQAGVPAAYIYPTNGGLQMLDFQASKLLRMQLNGALSSLSQTNLPDAIALNYPWVAAYIGTNWVQIFPWMKDTEVIEGLNFYDYMPTNYNSGFKWLQAFIAGDPNIFSLSESDQPADLLPKFIQKSLNDANRGLSVDDMGVQLVNRKHLYAQWSDFPKPFSLSGTPLVIESLKTNLNLFNTIRIVAYSQANPGKVVDSTELFTADLHNRKLLLKFIQVGTGNAHDMVLSLAPYSPDITNVWMFESRANPKWKLVSTNRLDSSDDNIVFRVTHKRSRFLPGAYVAPESFANSNLWGYAYFEQGAQNGQTYTFTDTFRKGDWIAFCTDFGRVTTKMLNVHAQEIWRFNQTANTNQPSTIDPDVYLGTSAYLMGMSYFNYVNNFDDFNDRLHKIQLVSQYQQGYGLIRPQRDANGNLINGGAVNPITPAVHMPNNGLGTVFNATLHPDSGRDFNSAHLDWWLQRGLQGSAAEHGILRSYVQTNATSTVSLLQQVSTNKIILTSANYASAGEVLYNGVALKNTDPTTWNQIVDFFADNDYDAVAYVTPGAVTNGTYAGVAALCVSYTKFAALVSGLNGGVGANLPPDTFTFNNSPNITVNTAPDNSISYYQLYTAAAANAVNGAVTTWDLFAAYNNIASGKQTLDPALQQAGFQMSESYSSFVDAALTYNQMYNVGAASSVASAYNDASQRASDPVNVMNGEFYIDSVDLTLPGPLPLQIRRNYGSQNLAENEFGFGWKISYVPFLSVGTNSILIYAVELDGSAIIYRQTPTNANIWLPTPQDNPTLNNNATLGIGSVANIFNNRMQLASVGGTNIYTVYGADGSVRTYVTRSFPIGSFTRTRPYLDTWRDNRGNFHSCEYGTDSTQPDYGEVRRIQASNGNYLGFYYDVYDHIIEAYTGDGRRLQYQYDKYGDLVTVTFPDLSQINYEYQHSNFVTNGVTNIYSTHLIARELKPDGRVLENIYDSQRRVTNQLATVGADLNLVRTATFAYTNNFSATSPTNLLTGVTAIYDYTNRATLTFYTNSLIRVTVDPLGGTEIQDWFETNSPGGYQRSLKSRTDKRGLVMSYQYDSSGNVTNSSVTGDLLGFGTNATAITSVIYNTNNLPLQVIDPIGNSVVYIYDTNFVFLPARLIKFAGSVGINTNVSEYVSITNVVALGSATVTNCAFGVISRQIHAFGSGDAAITQWFRDGRGFVTNFIQFTGTSDPNVTNQFLYNDREELVQRTDGAGRRFHFAFDDIGRPIATETYEAGQSVPMDWSYSYYNDNGELTWSDGARFNPEDYIWRDYDGAGRQTTEIRWRSEAKSDGTGVQAPAGDSLYSISLLQYDPLGNLTKTIDPRGNYSLKSYDAIGRVTREEFYDANGTRLSTNGFVYNLAGDVTNAFNPLGGHMEKQFTSAGQPEFQRNADGSTSAWRYYLDGRIYREIQNNGAYWETTYDDVNRKTTRVFHSSVGTILASNIAELDRRGNLIRRTDEGGNIFTNFYDGLNRLKVSSGPASVTVSENCFTPGCGQFVTNILQQSLTYFYDAAGVATTNVNALGEKTTTTVDAIGRPLKVEIRDANNTPVRVVSTSYSTDHNSVTVTNGSGTSAIVTTAFTDNNGQSVLSVAYPSASVREFTRNVYDLAGNLSTSFRSASSNSVVTIFTQESYLYDGLNRLAQVNDRDSAVTAYGYNSMGSVTNRTMPGGLQWNATYNNANQKLTELVSGTGGDSTQSNSYSYFASGNPFAGFLQTRTHPSGNTHVYAYDDWLRLTNIYRNTGTSRGALSTSWHYDVRSFATNITELDDGGTNGANSKTILRSYDPYGQLNSESITLNGGSFSGMSQTWNGAGRRSGLSANSTVGYGFSTRADGALVAVSGLSGSASYGFDTAGILTSRQVGNRLTTVDSRDGVGRPLTVTTKVNMLTKLAETLAYTGDGLTSAHTLAREDFTDLRQYFYADYSRRLTEERLNLDASHRWTNTFAYDNGTAAGIGVLTKAGPPSGNTGIWSGGVSSLSRIDTETNTTVHRPANGRVNGKAQVAALLDGVPQDVSILTVDAVNSQWPYEWQAMMEFGQGAHQLSVSATHPSGQFVTNQTIWFTNNVASEAATILRDNAGNVTQKIWRNPDGSTNRIQNLWWDARDRVYMVTENDSDGSGYIWTADYDALGRRLRTEWKSTTNGVVYVTPQGYVETRSYFDPQVEFLELGVNVDTDYGGSPGTTTWKLCGPDLNGRYGGLNGMGGFEGVGQDLGQFQALVADARGNILGSVNNNGAVVWTVARPTGYGAVPGYRPPSLGHGGDLVTSSAWRGRYEDIIGTVNLGARYYRPSSGGFESYDPTWNGRDPSFLTFAGGDPIDYFDPDGRCFESNQNAPPPLNYSPETSGDSASHGITAADIFGRNGGDVNDRTLVAWGNQHPDVQISGNDGASAWMRAGQAQANGYQGSTASAGVDRPFVDENGFSHMDFCYSCHDPNDPIAQLRLNTPERSLEWTKFSANVAITATPIGADYLAGKLMVETAEIAPLADILEGHSAGQGFTGVYDASTAKVLIAPSTAEADVPAGWVARAGGHADVSTTLGGDAANHSGFAVILQEDGTLNITWRSGTLNPPPSYVVPPSLRPTIIKAVQSATGRTINH